MSRYTTQLRWPIEQRQGETDSAPNDYSKCYKMLGLDDYPIFDESYREQLNTKIIRHFYFREIGFETLAQFAWYARNTMHEQMPYFNQLYESLNLITDPITNKHMNYAEVFNLKQTGSTTTEDTKSATDSTTGAGSTTTTTDHGHRIEEDTVYGKTETETIEYDTSETDLKTYGRTEDGTTETTYGKTQNTVNGGADTNTEGTTHERVIHSDTPMNQISNSGVENLNYATDVTYTDREGISGNVTQYGGTTAVTTGGNDTITSNSQTGGSDTGTRTREGTDTSTRADSGTDSRETVNSGRDIVTEISSTNLDRDSEGQATSAYERDLAESATRTRDTIGYDGTSPSKLLEEFRKTFINVDMQVIASLEPLFFGIWD